MIRPRRVQTKPKYLDDYIITDNHTRENSNVNKRPKVHDTHAKNDDNSVPEHGVSSLLLCVHDLTIIPRRISVLSTSGRFPNFIGLEVPYNVSVLQLYKIVTTMLYKYGASVESIMDFVIKRKDNTVLLKECVLGSDEIEFLICGVRDLVVDN